MKCRYLWLCLWLLLLTIGGCRPAASTEFAIYLTADDMNDARMAEIPLRNVELEASPLISLDDIVFYNWEEHEIQLTPEAYGRIGVVNTSVIGRVFVVCLDDQPVYWGNFCTLAFSRSFDGVVILIPMNPEEPLLRIQHGYPSADFSTGKDPRPDSRIRLSLERAGKLR